jgi:hypothetical protein
MTDSITPPPELVQEWWDDFNGAFYEFEAITAKVFQAGADQELEACCQHVDWVIGGLESKELRAARRPEPKPPSLKEQAIAVLEDAELDAAHYNILLRALEALPDD